MKPAFFLLVAVIFSGNCFAQNGYLDSIKEYQQKYTSDLYEIINDDTAFIEFYPVDTSAIATATVKILKGEEPFKLMTSSGKTKDAQKYALLTFNLQGKEFRLFAYQLLKLKEKEETATSLFVPFTDETCGEMSYGGGRYIDLDIKDIKNNKIMLDFNKAYNPYCAFTTGYNCPIPPRENDLQTSIKAGELYQADKFKH